jgi:uncharacterized protein YigE (DUF2233 family)
MKSIKWGAVSVVMIFLLSGIVVGTWWSQRWVKQEVTKSLEQVDQLKNVIKASPIPLSTEWVPLARGIELKAAPVTVEEASGQIVFLKIATRSAELQLEYSKQPKRVSEWAQGKEKSIVVNAGYFKEDFTPVGYLRIGGQRIDDHLSRQEDTGLLSIAENGEVALRDLSNNPLGQGEFFHQALQSFPFLIQNRRSAITTTTGSKARRTAIGLDRNRQVWLIFLDDPVMSLYEFADTIAEAAPELQTVLNLDGGSSSGLSFNFPAQTWLSDSQAKIPTVLTITEKEE